MVACLWLVSKDFTICMVFVLALCTTALISQDYWGGHKGRLGVCGTEVPEQGPGAVSYTHLTLPTILRV